MNSPPFPQNQRENLMNKKQVKKNWKDNDVLNLKMVHLIILMIENNPINNIMDELNLNMNTITNYLSISLTNEFILLLIEMIMSNDFPPSTLIRLLVLLMLASIVRGISERNRIWCCVWLVIPLIMLLLPP